MEAQGAEKASMLHWILSIAEKAIAIIAVIALGVSAGVGGFFGFGAFDRLPLAAADVGMISTLIFIAVFAVNRVRETADR